MEPVSFDVSDSSATPISFLQGFVLNVQSLGLVGNSYELESIVVSMESLSDGMGIDSFFCHLSSYQSLLSVALMTSACIFGVACRLNSMSKGKSSGTH
jgi:hypothetical protein